MKKQYIVAAVLVLAVLVVGILAAVLSGVNPLDGSPTPTTTPLPSQTPTPTAPTSSPTTLPTPTSSTAGGPTMYTYTVVNTYPHDTAAFTQGLVFDGGVFFESTGGYGASSLRQVDVESGHVTRYYLLPEEYFGEGLTLVNGSLIQLTWQNKLGFVYDKVTFDVAGNFSVSTEGWGLTYDGNRLILSDGSSNLYFLDPTTFQRIGQISVRDGNTAIANLNELEYVNGDVYANIWLQQKIAIINPQTGQVKGYIDLTGIYQASSLDSVLNGIAYDSQNDRLYVTGKNWPNLYEIKITPKK